MEANKIDFLQENNSQITTTSEYIVFYLIQKVLLSMNFPATETYETLLPLVKNNFDNIFNVGMNINVQTVLKNQFFLNSIFDIPFIHYQLENFIIANLKKRLVEMNFEQIINFFPEILQTSTFLQQFLEKLFTEKKLQFPVNEDYYKNIYESYNLSHTNFVTIFSVPDITYWYLFNVYKRGEKTIDDILTDDTLSEVVKKRSEKIIYKNYLTIGTWCIKKNKIDLIKYVLMMYCKQETLYTEFFEMYNNFLNNYGLENESIFKIEMNYSNRISEDYPVLWKHGQKLRYYNLDDYDFTEFYTTLSLETYKNIEFSTLKLFCTFVKTCSNFQRRFCTSLPR